ncbi:Pkinase-domain-containing protein [Rhizodiscina lignyota]|uniref:non-specific serine/threonine protein kinase n=1 Tax=Rhizodiscina lignyota TaxID=1504668 RepID=A0A9P4IIM0_9PEZI|nr:Pkinase-domain-containing protein [Rhizodiscina lignyota]
MAARPPPAGASRSSTSTSSSSVTIANRWQRLGEIGKGSFALVYKGIHIKKRSLVAIKSVQLYKLNKKLRENLYAEINILKSLQHPHIVALIDCQETDQHMHIVMEFCEMGDLSQFIKGRSTLANHEVTRDMMRKYPNPPVGGLNEVVARHFLKQIASALEFLRSKSYVHRDIKPQNLLLVPSPHWYVKHKPELMPLQVAENSLIPAAGVESLPMLKVADFGFARVLPQTSLAETLCGSPLYMAPEILRYEKYDAKADLWSVGTVLHEMMVGKPPFRANNHVELLRRIEKQEDKIKFPEGTIISSGMKALIRALLKKSPTERIGFEPFFSDPVVREEIPGLVDEDRPFEADMHGSGASKRMQKMPAMNVQEDVRDERNATPALRERPVSVAEAMEKRPIKPQGTPPSRTPSQRSPRPERAQIATPPPDYPIPGPVQQGRRPSLVGHATAPPRPVHDKAPVAAAMAIERRNSRNTPSPIPQRVDERALREARERAAQDVAFERDYIIVEKKSVEVNALADELAHSPQLRGGHLRDRPLSPQNQGAMVRRATTQGAPNSTTGATVTPSRAIQIATGKHRPEQTHSRNASYERRYGPNPGSATSAISKALNMANFRLFGMGFSPPSGGKGFSPPQGYSAFPTYPTAQSSMLMIGDTTKPADPKDEDSKVVMLAEELATRSDVIYGFAEVKYKQLLPATPSNDGGLMGIGAKRASEAEAEDDDDLTVDAIIVISEEALVLYVKALATLAKVMDIAGSWWGHKNRGEVISESPRSNSKNLATIGARMNNVVQWSRNRFNECYDKSEFVGRKLVDAQKQLPIDHPSHPSNHSVSHSGTSIGTSADDIKLTTGVTAEKLMYERACEMSRAAAVNELVNIDLEGCEIAYRTAILMLEAVLDTDEDVNPRKSSGPGRSNRADDDVINGLEGEDRASIQSILDGTKARLKSLKKKTEIQKASKRASAPATTGQLAGRSPPALTPPTITSTPPK